MIDTPLTKVLLLLGGTAIGLGLTALVWFAYSLGFVGNTSPQQSTFNSLAELRTELAKRDQRDLLPDKSVSLRSMIEPHPDDKIIYRLLPNLDVNFRGARVQTNTQRMRGRETTIENPQNAQRIALLSDSFGFGWGVEYEQSFATKLETILSQRRKENSTVEVLNFSVPGYSTFQQVACYKEFGRQYKPDAILVYFVENDFGPPFFIRNLEQPGQFSIGHQLPKILKKLDGNAGAQQQGAAIYAMLDPNRALEELADMAEADGTKLYLAINPRRNWLSDRQKLTILDQDPRINLIAMREPLVSLVAQRGIDKKDLILSEQDPHPTALMHSLLAEVLADGIDNK